MKALSTCQNRNLRTVAGAYKSTPIPVLEAEVEVPPIRLHLDHLLMRSLAKPSLSIVEKGCKEIQRRLKGTRGRPKEPAATPQEAKKVWMKEQLQNEGPGRSSARTTAGTDIQDPEEARKKAKKWLRDQWEREWDRYRTETPTKSATAHKESLGNRLQLHQGLQKAESSILTQLRTGHIGLNAYLHRRKVPGIESPACGCGWRYQDVKHILLFCPNTAYDRSKLLPPGAVRDLDALLSKPEHRSRTAKWALHHGGFSQLVLARRLLQED